MSPCKLCGKEAPLVRAHIIPESMYPFEEVRREPLIMVPSDPNIPRGKSRVGEYDTTLVCADCEATFAPWDEYAIRIFRSEPIRSSYIYVDSEARLYTLEAYDYKKLKLFFLSLLWRATESSRPFFEHVAVGSRHTIRLKHMIRNKDPGNPDEYSVFIVRFTHHADAHKAVLTPQRRRWGDDRIAFWHFYLAGYMCVIKVDQRLTPPLFFKMILRPNEPLRIFMMKFDETQAYTAMVSAVHNLRGFN
jgi:hypothetical protein